MFKAVLRLLRPLSLLYYCDYPVKTGDYWYEDGYSGLLDPGIYEVTGKLGSGVYGKLRIPITLAACVGLQITRLLNEGTCEMVHPGVEVPSHYPRERKPA